MDSRGKHRDFGILAMSVRPHQTTRGPSNRPSSSEVSLSFEDELAATIHGAFEVAVEIAVLEVSKLVGQALRDVRDQMHETVRENKSLKERLLGAERELDVLRGGSVEGIVQVGGPRSKSPLKGTRGSGKTAPSESNGIVVVDTDSSDGCFSEICEDGRVCSQHRTQEGGRDLDPSTDHLHLSAAKGNCVNVYANNHLAAMKFEQQHPEVVADDGSMSLGSDINQIDVKEENSEATSVSDPSCGANEVAGDSFGPDSLSLAQSKLLEDWRPEPLDNCDTESFTPCSSHSLSGPSVFSSVTTDSDGLLPAAGGLPLFAPPFSNSFHSGGVELESTSQQPFNLHISSSSSVTSSSPRMHVCKDCGVVFRQLGELRRHSQQHAKALPRSAKLAAPGRSPYHCSHCNRDFNRLENLKTHLRIHTGERPYTCSVCGVPFRHSGALTRHFRIHTGEKPYACSQCGKTFRNCGGLRFHQRSHMREGQSVAD